VVVVHEDDGNIGAIVDDSGDTVVVLKGDIVVEDKGDIVVVLMDNGEDDVVS